MEFSDILLLQIILLISLEGSTSWPMENENFTLPSNCPQTCGDIQIEYPFGIGTNCSYAVGFNLTCSHDGNHPRLLLGDGNIQVRSFDMKEGLIIIESPYVTLNADAQFNKTALINLKNLPLSFGLSDDLESSFGNSILHVAGCSAIATIFDLDTNTAIDACTTICSTISTSTTEQGYMLQNGYCTIRLDSIQFVNLSLGIQLNRLNENMDHMIINSTSNIIAVIYEDDFTDYDGLQRFIDNRNRTGIMASLAWYFNDHSTCKEAMKRTNTYACRSNRSECYDVLFEDALYFNAAIGYNCECSSHYVGNPYMSDGCKLDKNFTSFPGKDCPTKCGNVTFDFPFGLKQGCYREESFALTCNETSQLLYRDRDNLLYGRDHYHYHYYDYDYDYVVSKISLKEGQIEYSVSYDLEKETRVINWIVDHQSCKDAAKDMTTFACIDEHSSCLDVKYELINIGEDGYRCICNHGYNGNPYVHDGCQEINKCNSTPKVCTGICLNKGGDYSCICPPGTSGDPYGGKCVPHKRNSLLFGVILGVSIGTSLLLFCLALVMVWKKWKQRNQKKINKRNFLRNHGLLLQQLISTSDDHVEERTNIFSLEEIEKATNNFDETRVLGKGGHGTVYKGILSDQRVVAIKKSKIIKTSEIDQFINEIAVLSQINHRNVVKLLGCCLETEVPLLIYEFISNGTLLEHLHVSQGESNLSWDDRLRIATESAGALAYLHSAASMSVFHRDVKSSNILLDDTFKVKVSDFGASRFIPLDQTHIVTAIHGTFGYIDPEYYQTSRLTEKSDVYSFGIILLELLTGKKPIYSTKNGLQQNLAMNFLQAIKENMLLDLLEDRVLQEGTKQEFLEISSLIEICLNLKGAKRPTMKEVEYKLQSMRKTRIKKKGICILEGNEETECLLTVSSHSSSELLDQISQGNSRNYSFEKELMWSQNCAR